MKKFALYLLGAFFIVAGINHFVSPAYYLAMIPPFLPAPRILNAIAGVAEILGGIGVFIPRFRRAAGWGLIALLMAVFPANLYVAFYGWEGVDISHATLMWRLPFQALFIAWVYWTTIAGHSK